MKIGLVRIFVKLVLGLNIESCVLYRRQQKVEAGHIGGGGGGGMDAGRGGVDAASGEDRMGGV